MTSCMVNMVLRRARKIEAFDDFIGIGSQLSCATQTWESYMYPHFPYYRAQFSFALPKVKM